MICLHCKLKERPSSEVWDTVSGVLYQFHSQGIEEGEEPPPTGSKALVAANEFELALEPGILSPPIEFKAYFENRRDAERAERAIAPLLEHLEPLCSVEEVEIQDYSELWRQSFQPLRVPPHWLVRASWHEERPKKNEIEIILDPGMAFGTGSHETTQGCLQLIGEILSSEKRKNMTVLDFGCGSGILSVALKKMGLSKVYAVDIDPLAIEASRQNAELNRVSIDVSIALPSDATSDRRLDGIVANILKNTLLEFAPQFEKWLKPGGFLILSGLLQSHVDEVLERYAALGFDIEKRLDARDDSTTEENTWVTLLARLTSRSS